MLKLLLLLVALPCAQLAIANIHENIEKDIVEPIARLALEGTVNKGVWIADGDYIENCLPQTINDGKLYCVKVHVGEYRVCNLRIISSEGHVLLRCGDSY